MSIFFYEKKLIEFNNKILDKYQTKAVLNSKGDYLILAGAGSGKTLTISAKVDFLIKNNINPSKILCLSFTNETVNNLIGIFKNNKIDVSVMTYHKLALSILDNKYSISSADYLNYIVNEYFYSLIYEDNTYKLLDNNELYISRISKVITSFIHHMKVYNIGLEKVIELLKIKMPFDEKVILIFIIKIYIIYEEELKSSLKIDFDDMLNLAINEVEKLNQFSFKYIIIDEYQDISYSRFLLIKKLKERFDLMIIGVGDDYQSIYAFSGCNVKYLLRFKDMFKGGKIIKLKNNYRNPKDVVEISKRFVLKNNNQIKKRLISSNYIKDPIEIIYTNNEEYAVLNLIEDIDNILILGRNNKDVENILGDNFSKIGDKILYKDKSIRFLTVHKAKGLEDDYVILLNVVDDILGFPNKIKEFEIIRYIVNNNQEEEERRLFYVALTRCKKKIYLLTKKNEESIYIKEIIRDYKRKIKISEINL